MATSIRHFTQIVTLPPLEDVAAPVRTLPRFSCGKDPETDGRADQGDPAGANFRADFRADRGFTLGEIVDVMRAVIKLIPQDRTIRGSIDHVVQSFVSTQLKLLTLPPWSLLACRPSCEILRR